MAKTRRAAVLTGGAPVVLGVLVSLAGCGQRAVPRPDGAPASAAFTDEAGRLVSPRVVPTRRVISLAPSLTELLFAIGAGDQVVGIDNYSDRPAPLVARIAKVGTDYEPSIETIVALSPDIVFTSRSANRRETVEALGRAGITVFVTDTRAVNEMDRTLRSLGRITGHARESDDQISRLHAGLDAVARRVFGRPRPRVLVAVWDDPLYVAGRGTFTHDLIELAGGTNLASDVTGFVRYPLERVLRLAPDVIVLPTHATAEPGTGATAYWSRWSDLPAVRNQRVETLDDSLIIRPGARLVEGAERLARLVHPDIPAD